MLSLSGTAIATGRRAMRAWTLVELGPLSELSTGRHAMRAWTLVEPGPYLRSLLDGMRCVPGL